jgi:putative hydrolase of the HAD superfamily
LIRGVIFDYGETLVRSLRPWDEVKPKALRSVYSIVKKESGSPTYDRFVNECNSVFGRYAKRELLEQRDFPDSVKYFEVATLLFPRRSKAWQSRISSRMNEAFWRRALKNYVLQKSVRLTLDLLAKMKLEMAVVSNHHNPEALLWHLGELGIKDFFSPIIASAQLDYRKPDSRIFTMCLSTMNLSRNSAMYVGDSPENDVVGSRGAGLLSVLLVNPNPDGTRVSTRLKPDFIIRDLLELPTIVSGLQT